MVKHAQTVPRYKPTNCLSDHSVALALEVLNKLSFHPEIEFCSELTRETPEQRLRHCSGVFIVNFEFEYISILPFPDIFIFDFE